MAPRFEIVDTNTRQYRRYNAIGRQLTVCLIHHSDNTNPVAHFLAGVNDPFEHALRDVDASDTEGLTIQNQVNQNEKPMGINFIRKDELSGDVIRSVFERVSQSNSGFNALGTLDVNMHSVKMSVGYGNAQLRVRADRCP